MDDLDRKILALLAKNARMPVKEIAEKVALTSPAVSSRIHKLETDGIISGYTVMLNRPSDRVQLGHTAAAHLPHQGELRQYAPAGTPHLTVPEAGHHQHPDHPLDARQSR